MHYASRTDHRLIYHAITHHSFLSFPLFSFFLSFFSPLCGVFLLSFSAFDFVLRLALPAFDFACVIFFKGVLPMNINPAFQRMIIDTFLKNHREAILENVNNAVSIVEGFNDRFTVVENKIDLIIERMHRESLNDEILDVLEELKGESGIDNVVDSPDLPVDTDDPDFVDTRKDKGDMPNG